MLKKECLFCHEEFSARNDHINYCCALHHKYDAQNKNKVKKRRSRKFDPYFTETFFEDENLRRSNRPQVVR